MYLRNWKSYCGAPQQEILVCTFATRNPSVDIQNKNDDESASQIQKQKIHILVDLNGHSKGARTGVLIRKPAPIVRFLIKLPRLQDLRFRFSDLQFGLRGQVQMLEWA